ncbi:flagellar protein [Halanaerobium sp. Z-7514]|uniref:Flagellar protein n=1 Tax=Halanaerobium polyolivorans TaxID=2886943 RepID=A0AAW4X071_9FIRM|nr:TIGR02530 family flagellar biosynthesis protein [Halanaerobium polyolivorans]MCC3145202.1 flagellar protein [Halanaerobium polyolivorans]
MDNRININHPLKINQKQKTEQKNKQNEVSDSFKDILEQKIAKKDLSFSKHAKKRVNNRPIPFTKSEFNKLQSGAEKARAKGAKDSLIMVNNTAYIVSIENNKVITAVDEESMEDNVFTNIDSAVFMK